MEAGVDTGPIILRRPLAGYRSDTYERLVRRTLTLAGELMAETLALFAAGEVTGTRQDPAHIPDPGQGTFGPGMLQPLCGW